MLMLQELAPYTCVLVAGFHRAFPSTSLDKKILIFGCFYSTTLNNVVNQLREQFMSMIYVKV